MARGFFSGVIAGTLVSGVGLGTASVLSDANVQTTPQATTLEVPAGSEFNQSRDDTQASLPSVADTPTAVEASQVVAPEPDDLASLAGADTEPAAQPETGAADGTLTTPQDGEGVSGVEVDSESPVLPSPQAAAPTQPVNEESLSISTDPAQPILPDLADDGAAFPEEEVAAIAAETEMTLEGAPEPVEPPEADPAEIATMTEQALAEAVVSEPDMTESAPAEEVVVEESIAEAEPVAPEPAEEAMVEQNTADVEPEPAEEAMVEENTADVEPVEPEPAEEAAVEESTPEPEPAEQEPAEEAVVEESTAEAEPIELAPIEQEPAEESSEADTSSSIIGNLAPEVKTNRLPSVGDVAEEETVAEPPVDDGAEQPLEDTRPPLERFATEFENPDSKPVMSIVLIDDGSSPVGFEALESFPYPLSFAVDSSWSGAAEAMARYRAAGFEVLALIDLPEGSSAQDTEVAMQATLSELPEIIAVMDGTGSGLQTSRASAEQLAPILLDSGHGAVLFPKGLNTAQKLLKREGVPSASVFRDFDAKGQNATVIRRFLDQAAFKAGQEDAGVVMVGRLRPDTVSALLLWGLQDRAGRVALAPVSAMLRGE